MRSLVLVMLLALPAVGDEVAPPDAVLKEAAQVAATSARLDWCGWKFEPVYLTFMQFLRVPGDLSPLQVAAVGAFHGVAMQKEAQKLKGACAAADQTALKKDLKQKLDRWCAKQSERAALKARCDESRPLMNP